MQILISRQGIDLFGNQELKCLFPSGYILFGLNPAQNGPLIGVNRGMVVVIAKILNVVKSLADECILILVLWEYQPLLFLRLRPYPESMLLSIRAFTLLVFNFTLVSSFLDIITLKHLVLPSVIDRLCVDTCSRSSFGLLSMVAGLQGMGLLLRQVFILFFRIMEIRFIVRRLYYFIFQLNSYFIGLYHILVVIQF